MASSSSPSPRGAGRRRARLGEKVEEFRYAIGKVGHIKTRSTVFDHDAQIKVDPVTLKPVRGQEVRPPHPTPPHPLTLLPSRAGSPVGEANGRPPPSGEPATRPRRGPPGRAWPGAAGPQHARQHAGPVAGPEQPGRREAGHRGASR